MLPGDISTLVTKETMIVLAWWHGAENGQHTQKAKQSNNGKSGKSRNLDPKVKKRNIRLCFTPKIKC